MSRRTINNTEFCRLTNNCKGRVMKTLCHEMFWAKDVSSTCSQRKLAQVPWDGRLGN